jgi:hypothetical protein
MEDIDIESDSDSDNESFENSTWEIFEPNNFQVNENKVNDLLSAKARTCVSVIKRRLEERRRKERCLEACILELYFGKGRSQSFLTGIIFICCF